jgi:hypothetical protein
MLCFWSADAQDSHIPLLAMPRRPHCGIMLPHSKAAASRSSVFAAVAEKKMNLSASELKGERAE